MAMMRRNRNAAAGDESPDLGGILILDAGNSPTRGSSSKKARKGSRAVNAVAGILVAMVMIAVGAVHFSRLDPVATSTAAATTSTPSPNAVAQPTSNNVGNEAALKTQLTRDLEGCTIAFATPVRPENERINKPLWMPSYPNSGSSGPTNAGDILMPIVNGITGLATGAKNYHRSMRNKKLKRCRASNSDTAACSNGHPLTAVGPEGQAENFSSHVIVVLRNFLTAFPAMSFDKAIAYHKQNGQMGEDQWRGLRDQWMQSNFEGWKNLIMTWRKMDVYDVAVYVPYEHLLDATRGPELIKRMTKPFQETGYDVMTSQDEIACLWYQVSQKENARREAFYKYVPGYTDAQLKWMGDEMQKFADEVRATDAVLSAILDEYVHEIRNGARVDNVAATQKEPAR